MTTMAMAAGRAGRAPGRLREAWDVARGTAALVVAAALWAWLLAGVAAPLGATLASVRGASDPARHPPAAAFAAGRASGRSTVNRAP
jgi:hypothetical protein